LQEIKKKYQNFGSLDKEEVPDNTSNQYNKRSSLFSNESKGSKKSSRGSFVSYQRPISVWESPLKATESHLFYGMGFMIARGIDRLSG
jgi:hypothetical protein